MKKFTNFIKEGISNDKFNVSNEWLNNASIDDLNRIIIATSDGQDTSLLTIEDIVRMSKDWTHIPNYDTLNIIEILNEFYSDTNGNITQAAYFDGKCYKEIRWNF